MMVLETAKAGCKWRHDGGNSLGLRALNAVVQIRYIDSLRGLKQRVTEDRTLEQQVMEVCAVRHRLMGVFIKIAGEKKRGRTPPFVFYKFTSVRLLRLQLLLLLHGP